MRVVEWGRARRQFVRRVIFGGGEDPIFSLDCQF